MPDIFTYRNADPQQPAPGKPLEGTRMVIQPNLSVAGWPCPAGSRALAGYAALADATVIARLKGAGAVPTASARMAELGFGLAGDTSTQAVVAGHADLALITDTLGETRLAAAGDGLYGFKPSYGLVSRYGLIGLVPSMECIGLVAAEPARIRDALAVMAGMDHDDPSMPDDSATGFNGLPRPTTGKPCVAGVVMECLEPLDAADRDVFQMRLACLGEAGVTTRNVSLAEYDLCGDTHQVIAAVEASSSAGKYDGVRYGHRSPTGKNWNEMYLHTRAEAFGPLIKSFLFQGAYFQFENYPAFENACRIRGRLVQAVARLFGQVDLLVCPTRRSGLDPARAETIEAIYAAFGLTLPASLVGLPALQVPDPSRTPENDPGLQLIGRRMDDARVLEVGLRMATLAREGY